MSKKKTKPKAEAPPGITQDIKKAVTKVKTLKNKVKKAVTKFKQRFDQMDEAKAKKTALVSLGAVALILAALALTSARTVNPKTPEEMSRTTVMILNNEGTSGGTGVILRSSRSQSEILTNNHICKILERGGRVQTDTEVHFVTSYKPSQFHDLCLVTVAADLKVNTEIADSAPSTYSKASVAGHPSLLPTVVTTGHFSGREIVSILTDVRKCTEEDWKSENGILCMFFGGIPVIELYEAQVVSATIQPGSSGSAVFTEDGKIGGLVFAGSGELGYGLIVPYESVDNFVNVEAKTIKAKRPITTFSPKMKGQSSEAGKITATQKEMIKLCKDNPQEVQSNKTLTMVCKVLEKDLTIWRN